MTEAERKLLIMAGVFTLGRFIVDTRAFPPEARDPTIKILADLIDQIEPGAVARLLAGDLLPDVPPSSPKEPT